MQVWIRTQWTMNERLENSGGPCCTIAKLQYSLKSGGHHSLLHGTAENCNGRTSKAYHNCDSTIRYDYDEKLTCSFFACVDWKQARDTSQSDRSRIVVISQSIRNCNHGIKGRLQTNANPNLTQLWSSVQLISFCLSVLSRLVCPILSFYSRFYYTVV